MPEPTLSNERLDEIEEAVKSNSYAHVETFRNLTDGFDGTWTGDEAHPVVVQKSMEQEIARWPWPLVKVRNVDAKTALYALP